MTDTLVVGIVYPGFLLKRALAKRLPDCREGFRLVFGRRLRYVSLLEPNSLFSFLYSAASN